MWPKAESWGVRLLARALPPRVRDVLRFVREPDRYANFGPSFTHRKDGLATIHRADFMTDPVFRSAYDANLAAGAWDGPWGHGDPEWRMYVACWAAGQAAPLGGDFVECGVFRGGLSKTVMSYIGSSQMKDRTYWLLDTFQGIPADQVDETVLHRHRYPDTWTEVTRAFAGYSNVRLVRGRVPDTLPHVTSDRVCFVSIDMNVATPEIAATEYFWPRLVDGGVVVIDDYGCQGHEAQKTAFDTFAKGHQRAVLALPTGQGLLIK